MDRKKYESEINTVESLDKLNEIEIKFLGRNGIINGLLKKIKEIPAEGRKEYGQKVNQLKKDVLQLIKVKKIELSKKKSAKFFDLTLPGKTYPKGSLHIISYAIEEISRIFEKIGFIRVSYPEIDWEYFAFEALNMPKDHPARDDFETFFIDAPSDKKMGKVVLTPHTSSGQVREMRRVKTPPIRMINIVKCYRPNWDITHNPMFYQFEGLCIDRDINIAHLKGTIDYFAKEFFGHDRKIRLRPFHFQFTEPSFEIDVSCGVCGGTGSVGALRAMPVHRCKVCKSGWLELAGAGMVHPEVLRAGGIDPNKYSGWAFGFGPDRCLMMKTGIDNIRVLYNGDVRFLEQF